MIYQPLLLNSQFNLFTLLGHLNTYKQCNRAVNRIERVYSNRDWCNRKKSGKSFSRQHFSDVRFVTHLICALRYFLFIALKGGCRKMKLVEHWLNFFVKSNSIVLVTWWAALSMSIDTPFVVKLGDEIYVELHAIVVVLEVSHVVFCLKCSSFLMWTQELVSNLSSFFLFRLGQKTDDDSSFSWLIGLI